MDQLFSVIKDNAGIIFGALFAVSEAMALIPSVKSNSVFQLAFSFLQKEQPIK